jgi:hypothetical protein
MIEKRDTKDGGANEDCSLQQERQVRLELEHSLLPPAHERILRANVVWHNRAVPSVAAHPLSSPSQALLVVLCDVAAWPRI